MTGFIVFKGTGTTTPPVTPPVVPFAADLDEVAYQVTLTGSDGRVWDLNDGPAVLQSGARLFDGPPVSHWLKSSPGIAGSRWSGVQVEEQTITLPVMISGADWRDFRAQDRAFFKSVNPAKPFRLTVTSPDAIVRSIDCYLVSPGDITDDVDPLLFRRRTYALQLVAPASYWRGPTIKKVLPFSTTSSVPFFPGPPFMINTTVQQQTTTIANPGDVEAWARYTIAGPTSYWKVGVGDSVVSSSTVPKSNFHIYIDSAPGIRTILDGNGSRQYVSMDVIAFAPIPPGASVPIVAEMDGLGETSSITVEFDPLYWRPTS